tara:strand:+ start:203 stop:313 length:111 start_codon:yes stop_codon:yes gene_type:complete
MENNNVMQAITADMAHRAINERWKTNRINAEVQKLA